LPEDEDQALAALSRQLADVRGQVLGLEQRLAAAGITEDLNLAARFEELARTVSDALDAAAPKGPPAPRWTGIDRGTYELQLTMLAKWVNNILRRQYGDYELKDCWPDHPTCVWELSTLAAEWNRIYAPQVRRPSLDLALSFYDRFLPNSMKRISGYLRRCTGGCILTRRAR
jgi:hypothetical protein